MVTVTRSDRRRTSGFALFEYGYRPFFLLAALHGVVLVPIWVAAVFGWLALPVEMEVSWHAHEMVYGFAAAGLAGFMLTAVPNWTGAPSLRGAPLAGLALLWMVGRLAMTLPAVFPPQVGAGIDLAFIPALVLGIIGPLVAARKAHTLMLLIPLAVFWIGDWMMQAQFTGIGEDTAGTGSRIGIDVMLLMITVIGGRIIPTFTTNALHASGSSVGAISVPLVDRSAIAAMALLIIVEAVTEMNVMTGVVALVAAVLNAIRLAGWRGERTLRSPILWILHLGYLWLIVGLALKAAAALSYMVPDSAALHALTVGAIGTMLLAVMSRAALGHTGRPLNAHALTVGAYVLISVAAVLRVAAALIPTAYMDLLITSGITWAVGFALFLEFTGAPDVSGRGQSLVLVTGIGNPDRGDDGLGRAVARRLRARVPSSVRIRERSGDMLALIEDWRGFSSVIVVDAVAPAGEPGRIHRFELTDHPLPIAFAPRSTHAFGVAETVELARSLGRLPNYFVAYLVEGERFETGAPLSPAVAEAVDEVAERIIAELALIPLAGEPDAGAAAHA